ncbi:MAG: cadmium-translocating P-type ATPase [Alphaproteobacteria bacterium]|nr:MAG: cadmium-translocating P-type ATPase [Alphaproteobacteria bacterium]
MSPPPISDTLSRSTLASGASVGPAAAALTCDHCGGSLPERAVEADGRHFCCAGCEAAFGIVQGLGLERFYARRQLSAEGRRLQPDTAPALNWAALVRVGTDGRSRLDALVDGLDCAACVWLIERVLGAEPDVETARVNMTQHRLSLVWTGDAARGQQLIERVAALGFRLAPASGTCLTTARGDKTERELLLAIGISGFATMNVMTFSVAVWLGAVSDMSTITRDMMHWLAALIALPTILWCGLPFYRPAIQALARGRVIMDVPISLGILLTAVMSLSETVRSGPYAYFDAGISLLFVLLIGRYLDRRARARARASAEQMLALQQGLAHRLAADGTPEVISADQLGVGDRILVAPGERIPADGTVVGGKSSLDRSLVTGESLPTATHAGMAVHAGMLNLANPLTIAVTAVGANTLLAEIARLMHLAEQGRARLVELADRVASVYAPVVHTAALATFLGWWLGVGVGWQEAMLYAVAALIVTCPCGLALAVPAVQVVGAGRLLRRGILLKSATALERLASVDRVVFDKTGTLTLGRLDLLPDPARRAEDLALAAGLAASSRHPLAQALRRAAGPVVAVAGVEEEQGAGLKADLAEGEVRLGSRRFCGVADDDRAGPELWLVRPDRQPVRFAFADHLRPDAAEVVAGLKRRGYRLSLLSGDRTPTVAATAGAVGIEDWYAGLSPADKVRMLEEWRSRGERVLMVGDGLNDAPALAAATVSVSPATAADITQTAADAVFQGERLASVGEVLHTGRRSDRLVRQNLAFSLVYNVVAIPVAILGYVTPLFAALVMASSSLIVVLNALRLGWERGPWTR